MCWSWTSRAARNACTLRQVYKRIPIIDWLPHYDTNKAISDLIAGLTVGLTVIPQGIAYALVAELPPKVGNGDLELLTCKLTTFPFLGKNVVASTDCCIN